MSNDFIDMIEPTPTLHSKKCRIIAFCIEILLKYSIYAVMAAVWYKYDFFLSLFALMLSFIIVGIIRSKLRNSAIPLSQREYHYNDKGIAAWYTAKEICYDEIQ
ncbi:MAG: hypothetical protein QG559_646 [Campylobacterota bacterium]|nr:hypothetical protein [Campylobacterota bacterium]